jgi:hypothetical protein
LQPQGLLGFFAVRITQHEIIGFVFSSKAIRILFVSDLGFRASGFRAKPGELALFFQINLTTNEHKINWLCFFCIQKHKNSCKSLF